MKKTLTLLIVIMMPVFACDIIDGGSIVEESIGEVNLLQSEKPISTAPVDEIVEQLDYPVKPQLKHGAEINGVRLEHNVLWEDAKGMVIHVDFSTWTIVKGSAAAYFYFDSGTPLKDFNGDYRTDSGEVSVGKHFSSGEDFEHFSDFTLFIPYEELHMEPGQYSLKLQVVIWAGQKQEAVSDWVHFTFTRN